MKQSLVSINLTTLDKKLLNPSNIPLLLYWNDNNGNTSTGDEPDNLNNTVNNSGDDTNGKGIFDDTTGKSTDSYNRSQLPLGADIKNPDILGASIDDFMGPHPKANELSSKGTTFPIIRINDHYFQEQEIIFFSMETGMTKNYFDYQLYQVPLSGFLPTMKLIITTSNPGMLKQDHVK